MRLTQEQIDQVERKKIERETAEKIFAELEELACISQRPNECDWCGSYLHEIEKQPYLELKAKYLGDGGC